MCFVYCCVVGGDGFVVSWLYMYVYIDTTKMDVCLAPILYIYQYTYRNKQIRINAPPPSTKCPRTARKGTRGPTCHFLWWLYECVLRISVVPSVSDWLTCSARVDVWAHHPSLSHTHIYNTQTHICKYTYTHICIEPRTHPCVMLCGHLRSFASGMTFFKVSCAHSP